MLLIEAIAQKLQEDKIISTHHNHKGYWCYRTYKAITISAFVDNNNKTETYDLALDKISCCVVITRFKPNQLIIRTSRITTISTPLKLKPIDPNYTYEYYKNEFIKIINMQKEFKSMKDLLTFVDKNGYTRPDGY